MDCRAARGRDHRLAGADVALHQRSIGSALGQVMGDLAPDALQGAAWG